MYTLNTWMKIVRQDQILDLDKVMAGALNSILSAFLLSVLQFSLFREFNREERVEVCYPIIHCHI